MNWQTDKPYRPRLTRWFAWYPIDIGDRTYWLESVWRVTEWVTGHPTWTSKSHFVDYGNAVAALQRAEYFAR